MAKRTTDKWYCDVFDKVYILSRRKNGKEVYLAEMVDEDSEGMHEKIETVKANGKFLCKAVNSHDSMLAALKSAEEIVRMARQYFPKSIKNRDTFMLNNYGAAISRAIYEVEGKTCDI